MIVKTVSGIFCGILLLANSAVAQPDSLWSRTFGGNDWDYCNSVHQTSNGEYILGGSTESYGAGASDYWLVKTDAIGDRPWSRTFGGSNHDQCYSVQQTADGGYFLGGWTSSYGAGSSDFWLVKTDASGTEEWSRTFGGSGDDKCYSVQQTSDGGYILAGYTYSYGAGRDDFWLVKTDASGMEEWSRTFGGSNDDWCYSVQQTSDGGYILGGYTESYGAGYQYSPDFWLVKTDATGTEEWNHTFGGSGRDECNSIQQTTDGGYILGGRTASYGAGDYDFWLVKTDANGDSLWSRTFGGSNLDVCHSVHQTADGGYILGGRTASYGAGATDFWLVKTDSLGDSLWSCTFGGSNSEGCNSVHQTADGGYILGGTAYAYGFSTADFWLVKTGPELAVEPLDALLPKEHALHPNWPNPFNPTTTIRYDVKQTGNVRLTIFNLLGQEITRLVDSQHLAGSYTVSWNAADLPSGIYFYQMQTADFVQTRKMALVK